MLKYTGVQRVISLGANMPVFAYTLK